MYRICAGQSSTGTYFSQSTQFSFIIYHYQCSVFTYIHIPSTAYSLNTDISALVWTFLQKYDYSRLVEAKIRKCKSGVDLISISKVLKCMWFVSFCQYKCKRNEFYVLHVRVSFVGRCS